MKSWRRPAALAKSVMLSRRHVMEMIRLLDLLDVFLGSSIEAGCLPGTTTPGPGDELNVASDLRDRIKVRRMLAALKAAIA